MASCRLIHSLASRIESAMIDFSLWACSKSGLKEQLWDDSSCLLGLRMIFHIEPSCQGFYEEDSQCLLVSILLAGDCFGCPSFHGRNLELRWDSERYGCLSNLELRQWWIFQWVFRWAFRWGLKVWEKKTTMRDDKGFVTIQMGNILAIYRRNCNHYKITSINEI